MPTVEEVIGKYVSLRDQKTELAKRQSEEMAPLSQSMEIIESWLMDQMNQVGVDQFKASSGTAFRATQTSVQLQDPVAFKQFVFAPAVTAVNDYLAAIGVDLPPVLNSKIFDIIANMTRWDMVDFRAGKKGIQEYQTNEQQAVPGIAVNSISTINIRRA